jgi:outer membrane protein OmpA-like peptidoglycan-associated protein
MVAVLAIMALLVAAHYQLPPAAVERPPPVVEAPAPAVAPPPPVLAELVVVLPSADGHVGAVVVERAGRRIVLDQPYAADRVGYESGPVRESVPVQLSEREVRSTFEATLAAIPARPALFRLYFIRGSDELTEESRLELKRMLEEVSRRTAPDILVIGHTDRVGKEQDNDQLSLQRAERVRDSFIAQGIAFGRIRAAGRGEREPRVPTADGVDEPRNRRVEINVR